MNENSLSFGRRVLKGLSPEQILDLERVEGRSKRFEILDPLVGRLLVRSLQGERIVEMVPDKDQELSLVVHGLSAADRMFLDETYHLDRQQARGAWFLPTEVGLRAGTLHFPANFRASARFASNMTWEEHSKVELGKTADVLFVWALLEPLFDALFEPLILRGRLAGSKSREDQLKRWSAIDLLFQALALEVSQELTVMRYGGGWHKLRSQEQMVVKQRLLSALAYQIDPTLAARYRVYCLHILLEHYYKKADAAGRVKRKQALTKPLERILSGYFAGDWLAFLEYIGEEPHPEEQIVTVLPQTRLHVGGANRVAEVAEQMGIPEAEVQRMMAAYWQKTDGVSPIEQRVDFLMRYWQIFDEIHTRQTVGMLPLWGLVEDHRPFDFYDHDPNLPYQPRLYLQRFSQTMLTEGEQLWGTTMLPRWPDRIISEPSPHMVLAETMGAALKFWHGCALTAWFLCEGPSSRTTMEGLAEYYRREIKALEELGTPIERGFFDALVEAEKRLGPPQPLKQNSSVITTKPGVSITIALNVGTRREGFEKLRDIITHHRRLWAEHHLRSYLQLRWETEIREAGRTYNLLLSEMTKAPTPKQFADRVVPAVNHWFGGDISELYGALQEKSPVQPQRVTILPGDRVAFAFAVFQALGGNPSFRQDYPNGPQQDYQAWREKSERNAQISKLADLSFWYIQLEEGLGHPPTLKELGQSKFVRLCSVISEDVDKAWHMYSEIIATAKLRSVASVQNYQPTETPIGPQNVHVSQLSPDQLPLAEKPSSEQKRSWFDRLFKGGGS